ncbi:MAG: zinc ribbon domain-containing protein [Thermoplasmatota archaeon]
MAEEEQIICDNCDAEIPADSEKCPVCGAILIGEEQNHEESLDDVMEYIIGEDDDEEILDKIKTIGSTTDEKAEDSFLEEGFLDEDIEQHIDSTTPEYEEETAEEVKFECPVCGTIVSEDDPKCPNCGAIFETEEEDVEKMEELENGIDFVESELKDLKDSKIDLTYLNNGLNDLIDSYEESRYEEGLEILDVVKTQIEDIKEIINLIELSEQHLEVITENIDTTAFEKRLEAIIDEAEVGEYKSSLKNAKALNEELEELKSEHTGKEEDKKNELDKKIEEARSSLSDVRGKRIDISDIKEYMKKAVSAKKDNNFSDGISKSEKVIDKSEKVLKVIELIDEGKEKIKEMKGKEMSYGPYLDRLKDAKSKADHSEYQESIELLNDVIEDMEGVLEGGEEEVEEEKKTEKSIEDENLADELNELIKEGKKNYNKVKKSNISVRSIKDHFKEAVKAKKEGNFELGIEKVKKGNERSEKILEISEIIDEAKSKIKTLKEKDIDHKEYLNRLKDAKKLGDEGEYEECREETEDVIKQIETAIEEAEEKKKEKEKRAELKDEINGLVEKFDELTDTANELYINIEEPIKTKKSALEKREEGKLEECIKELEEANEIIHLSINDEIEEKLMELELNLEDAWDEEAKLEAEKLIEKIREKIDKGRYEEIDELIDEAKDKTQNAKGPISKIEEEISNTEDLIFEGKMLEFDVSDAEDELEKAKEELDVGDWEESEKRLKKARENIGDKLPKILKSDLKKSKKELREAKIKGIDISNAVSSIKEVKNARRDGKLNKAFQKYQEFKEEMDKIKDQY